MQVKIVALIGFAVAFSSCLLQVLQSLVEAVETIFKCDANRHPQDIELVDETFRISIYTEPDAVDLVASLVDSGKGLVWTEDQDRHESGGGTPCDPASPREVGNQGCAEPGSMRNACQVCQLCQPGAAGGEDAPHQLR